MLVDKLQNPNYYKEGAQLHAYLHKRLYDLCYSFEKFMHTVKYEDRMACDGYHRNLEEADAICVLLANLE